MVAAFSRLPDGLRRQLKGIRVGLLVSLTVIGLQQAGLLQSLELGVYDQWMRWRPSRGPDPRLLIVSITEADLHAHGGYPISDRALLQLLQELERHQPQVVGLDIYRDLPQPPDTQQLRQYLSTHDTVVITKVRDQDNEGIPPPPGVSPHQVGFNDVLVDAGGVVRRQLLYLSDAEADQGYYTSFALHLAFRYLAQQDPPFYPAAAQNQYLQLGQAVFAPMGRTFGNYQTVDDRGYQILLNYRTSEPIAPQVTLTQVLDGEVEPEQIRDRVVLIGSQAISSNDAFYTPYSLGEQQSQQMAGVELQAQMVSQILDAALGATALIWAWPNGVEGLWIILWGTVGCLWVGRIRHPLQVLLAGLGTLGALTGVSFWIFLHQGWIPTVAPVVSVLGAAMAGWVLTGQSLERQQQIGRILLDQNTSKAVADILLQQWEPLIREGGFPSQTLQITVLFADLREFSALSERLLPQQLREWLNEYFMAQTQLVDAHHGFISKFIGDGLMAIFGLSANPCQQKPEQIAAAASDAVTCALAMMDCLERLNRSWQARGLPTTEVRVGIATGVASVGTMGGRDRLEYGVIGDSVNIASRLESYDKGKQPSPCRVLIDRATLEHVQDQVQVEDWGLLALRGRQQAVRAYRVLS